MNKSDLITHVARETGLSKAASERAISSVFEGITSTLSRGNDARFIGFGTFSVTARKARMGRNPRTGAQIRIPASNQARFRAGKELKEAVN
ncbi:MAG: HU family DNA-binding protein [Pseudomonadota bacterium]